MGYWSFLKAYWLLHLRTALEYKVNFVLQSVFMMLNNTFFVIFWYFIFQQVDTVRGWGLSEVVLLFGFGAFSFGVLSFFFGNWRRVNEVIEEGGLDFYLALPKDELLHVLVGRSRFDGFGDILFGLGVVMLFHGFSSALLAIVVYGMLGAVIWASLLSLISSLAFVFGKAHALGSIGHTLAFAMTTYPYTLFPFAIKFVFFVVFPVFFITNVPVLLLQEFSWWLFGLLVFVAFVSALASWSAFRAGIKRYESGNLIHVRT